MDSTFYDLLETKAGGSRPPKPLETNPPCNNTPSLRLDFNFIATMAANRPWLVADVVAVPGAQHPLPKHPEKASTKI